MTRVVRAVIIVIAFFASAHRLPAPIQEIPETPTPAPEQPAKTKQIQTKPVGQTSNTSTPRRTSSPRVKSEATPVPKSRAALEGTWVGIVHTFPTGDQSATFVINPSETTFTLNWYGKTGTVPTQRAGGSTLTATFPQTSQPQSQVWTITPQPDGVTVLVHFQAFLNDSTTVFRRAGR
jgi:hypothetical protein